ncbi:hypothetical protein QNO21_08675 [Microbacterium sp. zg-Y818]|uniref:hypothetical protein n=1 Tax=unclassified Microbacterium TaxID=2609290 RepID=UPI00214AB31E|nr:MULTISPECIES: hypothetical protein [unclassified Microbacterium]MCR2801378.1 hypothetical protein [Microbacterium sp. zg.Y818]WIM21203.1 hypothetical protein QNO21_08675 [Microbacterium sp. zg-Y818]
MSDLADAVGRAVLAAAQVDDSAPLGVDEHLALIAASARAEREVREILQRSVAAARGGGASWALIGAELGMSRQAAQQRFGGPTEAGAALGPDAVGAERWLGPVTAFDEMTELDAAGRAGWRTVEVGMLSHRMVRTDTQWEPRRIFWRASPAAEERDGWQVACRAFPWIYLVRDRGIPPEGT